MKKLFIVVAAGLTVCALGALSRRLATHKSPLPEVTKLVNTRVTRINQH